MKKVKPFLETVFEEIISKINKTQEKSEEMSREIAIEMLQRYNLSFFEKRTLKRMLEERIGLTGI